MLFFMHLIKLRLQAAHRDTDQKDHIALSAEKKRGSSSWLSVEKKKDEQSREKKQGEARSVREVEVNISQITS